MKFFNKITTPILLTTAAVTLSACMGNDYANRAAFIEAPIKSQSLGFEYQSINLN